MSCCQTPSLSRLEKIKENRTKAPSKTQITYSPNAPEMPAFAWSPQNPQSPGTLEPFPELPPESMTPVIDPNSVVDPPTGTTPAPGASPLQPGPYIPSEGQILPESPQFQVPANPLLPPGYQEVLDYESLQYINGFYRTQIGKFVRVDQLIGSNEIVSRYGYLIGVGINYILLQDPANGNVSAIDSYSIKYFYVYYNTTASPFNM